MTERAHQGGHDAGEPSRHYDDDVCITCSDQAVRARVVELRDHGLAIVDTGTTLEQVSVALVAAKVDDWLLVHAKEAIAVVEPP